MVFQCINIRQVPWEVLKTAAFGLRPRFLTLPPRDLANVNAWKTMFDPYIEMLFQLYIYVYIILYCQLHNADTCLRQQYTCN